MIGILDSPNECLRTKIQNHLRRGRVRTRRVRRKEKIVKKICVPARIPSTKDSLQQIMEQPNESQIAVIELSVQ